MSNHSHSPAQYSFKAPSAVSTITPLMSFPDAYENDLRAEAELAVDRMDVQVLRAKAGHARNASRTNA